MEDGLGITVEELQVASQERIGALQAGNGTPVGTSQQPVATDATDHGSQSPANLGSPGPGPGTTVLDAFPEEIRTHVAGLPSEVLDELHKGYLRRNDYTVKTQTLAEQRREATQDSADAEAWRKLVANPKARAAVLRAVEEGEQGGTPDKPFSWTTATDAEIENEITRRSMLAAERIVQDRVAAPAQRVTAAKQAAIAYRGELGQGISDDAFKSAFSEMVGQYGQENVNAQNVRLLLEPFVRIEQLKSQVAKQVQPTNGYTQLQGRIAHAASEPSGGGVAPAAQPLWKVEKRQPTEDERITATLNRVAQMTGTRMTTKDLDDLLLQGD